MLSISDLYGEVERALVQVFPRDRQLWVQGEIHSIADQTGRTGHCYIDLVEPDAVDDRQAPVLRVKCWRGTWGPLRALLAGEGIELQVGMTVVLRGNLDFYRPRAEVGFILAEIDVTSLLGRLAAQRAALIRALTKEGLLERNGALPLADVPLRIGLVASPETEGYRDFLGQLTGSGYAFDVVVAPTPVQGAEAPQSIARAFALLAGLADRLDLIVVVRGGGSKADLAAFDSEAVARAIATAPLPVWTGIGHTGDESVADLVAHRTCITPTACGRELALRVASWWDASVTSPVERIIGHTREVVSATSDRLAATRVRIAGTARIIVDRQVERTSVSAEHVVRNVNRLVADAGLATRSRALRVAPLAVSHVERVANDIVAWRHLLAAYDVERQLARGYTLNFDEQGQIVRSVVPLGPGSMLTTRFFDGTARSTVSSVTRTAGDGGTVGTPLPDDEGGMP
ncbi:MAG: exodeoxyribonuclease VII large subunit [Acidimicrobiales bacterium]